MKNKVKPTFRQLKALDIKKANPKMSMRQVMIKAGYSVVTASHPKQNLIEARGGEIALEQYTDILTNLGLTRQKLAEKQAEWLDAQKPIGAAILVTKDGKVIKAENEGAITVPDYQTQIKAGEMLRDDLGVSKQPDGNLKRRIVAEEFFDK